MSSIFIIIFQLLKFLLMAIPVLISVAYLTLTERKVIGYTQLRKGPNLVGVYGLLQPLADGVKLFSKEIIIPNHANTWIYLIAPILALTISLVIWSIFPLNQYTVVSDVELGLFFIFALSSINVYSILMSGWSSNSKYAFLGALRAAAQMISYEISIGLLIITVIFIVGSLNLTNINLVQTQTTWFILPLLPVGLMFFISCLAETNRAPFDLTEGESELVSGYNVEYSSMVFASFFLAEYAHIIFMSFLFSLLFLGGVSYGFMGLIIFIIKSCIIIILFVWVRTSFPRLRYDQLMHLLWKTFLPLSIGMIIITHSVLWAFGGIPPLLFT